MRNCLKRNARSDLPTPLPSVTPFWVDSMKCSLSDRKPCRPDSVLTDYCGAPEWFQEVSSGLSFHKPCVASHLYIASLHAGSFRTRRLDCSSRRSSWLYPIAQFPEQLRLSTIAQCANPADETLSRRPGDDQVQGKFRRGEDNPRQWISKSGAAPAGRAAWSILLDAANRDVRPKHNLQLCSNPNSRIQSIAAGDER